MRPLLHNISPPSDIQMCPRDVVVHRKPCRLIQAPPGDWPCRRTPGGLRHVLRVRGASGARRVTYPLAGSPTLSQPEEEGVYYGPNSSRDTHPWGQRPRPAVGYLDPVRTRVLTLLPGAHPRLRHGGPGSRQPVGHRLQPLWLGVGRRQRHREIDALRW